MLLLVLMLASFPSGVVSMTVLGIRLSSSMLHSKFNRSLVDYHSLITIAMPTATTNIPLVLRYARQYELCYDFRRDDVLHKLDQVVLLDEGRELPDLPHFISPYVEPPAEGQIQISQRASELLIPATTRPSKPSWADLFRHHRQRHTLKVEQPLLLTDHARDTKRFLPKQRLEVGHIAFSLELLDHEKDEGPTWPTYIRDLRAQWDEEISQNKLPTSKETLRFLIRVSEDRWTQDDLGSLVRGLLMLDGVRSL